MRREDPFVDDPPDDRASDEPRLVVDVGGFEGPLDLLLDLARRQKVDLHEISILALAEQYLAFIEGARAMRLELAADYLVMAAWLAYLKSRLLLPEPPKAEAPSATELATALAFRLRRLDAIREAAKRLGERDRLGREVFPRGEGDVPLDTRRIEYGATLFDLLAAYAGQRQRRAAAHVTLQARPIWPIADAREALERLVGRIGDWVELESYLLRFHPDAAPRTSIVASALSVALELVREGRASLRQDGAFAPLMIRAREPALRVVAS